MSLSGAGRGSARVVTIECAALLARGGAFHSLWIAV